MAIPRHLPNNRTSLITRIRPSLQIAQKNTSTPTHMYHHRKKREKSRLLEREVAQKLLTIRWPACALHYIGRSRALIDRPHDHHVASPIEIQEFNYRVGSRASFRSHFEFWVCDEYEEYRDWNGDLCRCVSCVYWNQLTCWEYWIVLFN